MVPWVCFRQTQGIFLCFLGSWQCWGMFNIFDVDFGGGALSPHFAALNTVLRL